MYPFSMYTMYMKNSIFFIFLILSILTIYWISAFYSKIKISKELVAQTIPYKKQSEDVSRALLVLGDSTAVGVGASSPLESVPGRLATYGSFTYVENHAVSGATIEDLNSQITKISQQKYDTILIQIGGNDIVRFHSEKDAASALEKIIIPLKDLSTTIVLISAGNVGEAPLVPFPLKGAYTRLNKRYHESFAELGEKRGIIYISTYLDPSIDPFVLDPENYFAADSFHPSSLGYKVWFDLIAKRLYR